MKSRSEHTRFPRIRSASMTDHMNEPSQLYQETRNDRCQGSFGANGRTSRLEMASIEFVTACLTRMAHIDEGQVSHVSHGPMITLPTTPRELKFDCERGGGCRGAGVLSFVLVRLSD